MGIDEDWHGKFARRCSRMCGGAAYGGDSGARGAWDDGTAGLKRRRGAVALGDVVRVLPAGRGLGSV